MTARDFRGVVSVFDLKEANDDLEKKKSKRKRIWSNAAYRYFGDTRLKSELGTTLNTVTSRTSLNYAKIKRILERETRQGRLALFDDALEGGNMRARNHSGHPAPSTRPICASFFSPSVVDALWCDTVSKVSEPLLYSVRGLFLYFCGNKVLVRP